MTFHYKEMAALDWEVMTIDGRVRKKNQVPWMRNYHGRWKNHPNSLLYREGKGKVENKVAFTDFFRSHSEL
jgi:hypothetical protein